MREIVGTKRNLSKWEIECECERENALVCVCVCERERELVCMCVFERECVSKWEKVWACVCEWDKKEWVSVCVCEGMLVRERPRDNWFMLLTSELRQVRNCLNENLGFFSISSGLPVCLPVCLSLSLSLLCVCLFVCLSVSLFLYYVYVCLSLSLYYVSVCLSVYLSLYHVSGCPSDMESIGLIKHNFSI